MATAQQIDWQHWIGRWDAMQSAYLPFREERFAIMFDTLEALVGDEIVAIDLASGPGAISQRLLARFPRARCVAVDYDPSLLALGRGALGDLGGRLRWVEADLRDPGWIDQLKQERVDAVLSTTALHWLDAGALAHIYQDLGVLVRSGGILLNGDHMRFPPQLSAFQAVADRMRGRREKQIIEGHSQDTWRQWWTDFARQPGMAPLVEERERRFTRVPSHHTAAARGEQETNTSGDEDVLIGEVHEALLRNAGFHEVGVIWRQLDDGVLLAVR
jgi:Methyltransferase domain